MRRHPQSDSKTSTLSDPSPHHLRVFRRREALKPTPRSLSRISPTTILDASAARSASAPSAFGSSSDHSDTSLELILDEGLAKLDATNSDIDVGDDSQPSDSYELRIETPVALSPDDEGTSDIEVEELVPASLSPSSIPIRLSRSSPPTSVEDVSSPRDEVLEHPSQLSYSLQHKPSKCSEACSGDDCMVPLSCGSWEPPPYSSPAPCQGWRWKRQIAFPRSELSKEGMQIIRDYMSKPNLQGHELGGVPNASVAKAFEGVTEVSLFIDCPGWHGDDDKGHRERRLNGIMNVVHQLGAIVGDSLRGLQITAPWPELTFPYVPDILAAIVDGLPGLELLRFEELQCRCNGCKSLYTDTTKFTRLQVAALEGQVSRPLTSTKLQKLSIERKSMDSLEKDFIKYTGDAERSTSEALLGSWTIRDGYAAKPTTRAQGESQFFTKLLKRYLPSVINFLLVTPELRATYVPLSSSAERPPAHRVRSPESSELEPEYDSPTPNLTSSSPPQTKVRHESSYVSSCTCSAASPGCTLPPDARPTTLIIKPRPDSISNLSPPDDVSDEPAQNIDHTVWRPQSDAIAQGYGGLGLNPYPEGPTDAGSGFTLSNGVEEFDSVSYDAFAMSMQDGEGYGTSSGDGGLSEQPLPSLPAWSCGSVARRFGGDLEGHGVYTGALSNVFSAPVQNWAVDIDCQHQITPEGTMSTGDPMLPPDCYGQQGSAVVVAEESRSLESANGTMWTWSGGVISESTAVLGEFMPLDSTRMYAPAEHLPVYGYPETWPSVPSCQREMPLEVDRCPGSVITDENILGPQAGENGGSEGCRRLWGGMNAISCPEGHLG